MLKHCLNCRRNRDLDAFYADVWEMIDGRQFIFVQLDLNFTLLSNQSETIISFVMQSPCLKAASAVRKKVVTLTVDLETAGKLPLAQYRYM